MADFAFRKGDHPARTHFAPVEEGDETDVLRSRARAREVANGLRAKGHDARVERSGSREHRVWIQHPEHKDTFTYVHNTDVTVDKDGIDVSDPHWIRK